MNPSGNPQMPQVGIPSEQPLESEAYKSYRTPAEQEASVRALHQYTVQSAGEGSTYTGQHAIGSVQPAGSQYAVQPTTGLTYTGQPATGPMYTGQPAAGSTYTTSSVEGPAGSQYATQPAVASMYIDQQATGSTYTGQQLDAMGSTYAANFVEPGGSQYAVQPAGGSTYTAQHTMGLVEPAAGSMYAGQYAIGLPGQSTEAAASYPMDAQATESGGYLTGTTGYGDHPQQYSTVSLPMQPDPASTQILQPQPPQYHPEYLIAPPSSIGPERYPIRDTSRSRAAHPYHSTASTAGANPGLVGHQASGMRVPEPIPLEEYGLGGGGARVMNTRQISGNLTQSHRSGSRPTQPPSLNTRRPQSRSPEDSTNQQQVIERQPQFENAMRSAAQPVLVVLEDLSNEEKRILRKKYTDTARPGILEFLVLTSPFPSPDALTDKCNELLRLLHNERKLDIETVGEGKKRFKAFTDERLQKMLREIPGTLRGLFKQAATYLVPVLLSGFGPPGMHSLATDDVTRLVDVAQLCEERRISVWRYLAASPSSTGLLHVLDAEGNVTAPFERDGIVPSVLDAVIFQRQGGLYYTHTHLFSEGVPDTLVSLAASAVISSLREFESGRRSSRDFSRDANNTGCENLTRYVQTVKASATLGERYNCVNLNVVQHGRGWGPE
ncbi:uncharacterized protein B0H18DRAFT_1121702 [Fomitopsis serialis]|uniref:uncharacterized protein n=1 Tax=Fomitopsis serialis TaxID=139415 RepID=UPI002007F08C|nr:uncharacterized protein B0H18DRAFT_1121702 [Neoantrodia serialis]KAH9920741.1 hypothetical protein B0H18DRAFT_1121702 [Neoantrodia serialis]